MVKVGTWPAARLRKDARKRPQGKGRAAAGYRLDFGLLGNLQGIIDLDAKVPNSAFQLGMAEQKLNGPQVLRAFVDQGCLRPPHRVRPVGRRIQPSGLGPVMHDPGILARRDMWRPRNTARKEVLVGSKTSLLQPG